MEATMIFRHTHGMIGKEQQIIVSFNVDGKTSIICDGKVLDDWEAEAALSNIFCDAIDLESWKHSWHLEVSKFKTLEVRDKIRKIIQEYIGKREGEVKYLTNVQKVLMAQVVYAPESTEK